VAEDFIDKNMDSPYSSEALRSFSDDKSASPLLSDNLRGVIDAKKEETLPS
jgi:hypothetical protein